MSDEPKHDFHEPNVFFTADQHFGHKNIIGYENRPFKDVQEMDRALIINHNSIVQPRDEVWHLGDFSFYENPTKVYDIWQQLNGHHHFIIGNHDKWLKKFLKVFTEQALPGINLTLHEPLIEITRFGQRIVLCHYSLRAWRGAGRGTWMLFGHSHGNLKQWDRTGKLVEPLGRTLDVGVDNQDLFPIGFDKLKGIMDNKGMVTMDHHEERDG